MHERACSDESTPFVDRDRTLVERGDAQLERARREPLPRERKACLEEGLAEPAAREVGAEPRAHADAITVAAEPEEADQLSGRVAGREVPLPASHRIEELGQIVFVCGPVVEVVWRLVPPGGDSLGLLLTHERDPDLTDVRAHGIAPIRCTHRAAVSRARSGPPTMKPAARASPAPVVSTTCSTGSAARSSPSNEQPRAPRLTIHLAPGSGPPTMRSSSSFEKTTSGASSNTSSRNASAPESRIALHDARSTLTCAPSSLASARARRAASRTGS